MNKATSSNSNMNDIVSLCKRRGFIFQSSEIYGGLQGVYDYGPLGIELKRNLQEAWWKAMVYARDDVEGIDTAILSHPQTLKYSGHEDTFTDPMVDCHACKTRLRADHVIDHKCNNCGSDNLTAPRNFNLMFKANFGPIDDGSQFAYLRPETAQGIFINFKNVITTTSRKLPFGVAQIGKSFRNEVSPRNFIFRMREFEQMELEFFVLPGTDEAWHKIWIEERLTWWQTQGLSLQNLKLANQSSKELSHYAKATCDILYKFPHGFEELEGIANRTDFDLGSHTKSQDKFNLYAKVKLNHDSIENLSLKSPQENNPIIPYVIEPSAGLDRGVLAVLTEAYTKETLSNGDSRIVLKLKPHLSPVKVAVIPLVKNNPDIMAKSKEIKDHLLTLGIGRIKYEDGGNIGKAYRKHDEIGTPFCLTVDFTTIEDQPETVTIRYRDNMMQERILVSELATFIITQINKLK